MTEQDLNRLLTDVMWTEQDATALRRAGILAPRASEILDVWYDFIGSTPHLVTVFRGADGEPDQNYLAKEREQFEQWVSYLCTRDFDGRWLNYQEEIGLRRHSSSKNQTDGVDSPATHVPRPRRVGTSKVDDMQQAWFKAVTVSLVLWTRPYAAELW